MYLAKLIWDRISDVYEGAFTRCEPWFEDFKNSMKTMEVDPALVRVGAIQMVFNPFRDGIWNHRQVSVGDRGSLLGKCLYTVA